ncbi:equilibrative nucleoside transporter 1-like [Entelurus aequoreus]|uniref:equilibrative nucleoside transporter 1-like n=1 Tax=Entelurus aequoreus TaxID=161455 RepID=UPI002B1DBA82|nr:equilibrative nucleoside transporter 1-like [Entelurus aequoreus]
MTAFNSPRDKYNGVWIIFFILGLGTLLPWNFFMTATMYFTSRLKDSPTEFNQTANQTNVGLDTRNVLESKFNNVMTLCAMVPLLIFTCLNSFIHQRIPQKLRISGSLTVILVVFLLTALLVKVDVTPLAFFTLTMIKIIFINSFGAILQGSLFGVAGILPASYTTPFMSGQGLAGTFAAFSMICALATFVSGEGSSFPEGSLNAAPNVSVECDRQHRTHRGDPERSSITTSVPDNTEHTEGSLNAAALLQV